MMDGQVWTDAEFDAMSWHDNHVHGLRIIGTGDGTGELVLDIDYIVEWICGTQDTVQFRILPATLTFHGVMFPRISLDYATPAAGLAPFMISGVERRMEQRERYVAQVWTIAISWPAGAMTFEARGFTQRGRGEPVLSARQCLDPVLRGTQSGFGE